MEQNPLEQTATQISRESTPPASKTKWLFGLAALILAVLIVIGFFAYRAVLSQPSDRSSFEELVAAIESGERVLEDGYMPDVEATTELLNTAPIGVPSLERWSEWENTGAIDSFIKSMNDISSTFGSELSSVKAELIALRFKKDSELDRTRDKAVEHFSAWQAEISATSTASVDYFRSGTHIEDWPYFNSLSDVFSGSSSTSFNEINETFEQLCVYLSDAQPLSGKYEERIVDICDD